ncbi:MAG: family 10 glycosylhydrolase [candidate division KSB1 bacterium]|nr:family 10 glycosylhydrolase [candidate division KSB1 bacterium]MDZ7276348.1 family 10 glycosylhydrolase [candidate division KSB1 bacterium]MDZ7287700.1 family 10 glycosylhydrolase [candidate division KSB1 bacterium]MDZ7299960.1 family 10 glycosylhydrolase [candidate division KSB1 bacterium]MDZ7305711.1 family 10 glycosylhydrolase [candidate division KSB1 bacterium]
MHIVILLLMILSLTCRSLSAQTVAMPVELRGVWLTNVDSEVLDSRARIEAAMHFLAEHHFNVVYPVVWNKAMTTYRSAVMDSLFGLAIDPRYGDRDPLQELSAAAHRHGLAVIPWFEFGFSASYQENGGHLLRRKPHWAERDRDGKLLTKNGFEWMNPYHPEVQEFMLALVLEVVRNYAVDGVQGDDRLPANPSEGGYSAFTDSLYRAEHHGAPPPRDAKDPAWLRWRADKLNAFAQRLYRAVKAVKPQAIVSWAPSVYPWSYEEYLQDWPAWIRGGYADAVHPQVYRYSFADYRRTLDEMAPQKIGLTPAQQRLLHPGILMNLGDYRMPVDYLLAALAYNRQQGYAGEVFFFYEGLRRNQDELADTLRATFYRTPARLPWRAQ